MSALDAKQTERLDKIYYCTQCKSVFLFKSDVEDHEKIFGHDEVMVQPFK